MKLDLNFKIKDLEDKEISNSEPINKILGNALAMDNDKRDPLKFMEIGRALYTKGLVNLDQSDLNMLREKVQAHDSFTNLLKATILETIDKAKLSKES